MKPRFTIRTRYTEEEFVRFNRTIQLKEGRLVRTMIFANAALLVMIVTSFVTGNIMFAIPLMIFLAAVNLYFFKGIDMRASKLYRNSKMNDQTVFELVFYDDHYEGAADGGAATIPYAKLHRIIETPTNFYILGSPMSGTILQKSECPDDFIAFIHDIKAKHNL